MNWKELECTGIRCNHETLENHYIVFDRDIKHSQQQLLESLELEFQERYGKDGGDALVIISSHDGGVTQRPALPEVKALIQSKKPL